MQYAEIVVHTPLHRMERAGKAYEPSADSYNDLSRTFHYRIPPELDGQITPGQLVLVPFNSRALQGVVVALSDSSPLPPESLKDILQLLDPKPVLLPYQLELARWISHTYCSPLLDAILLLLPLGMRRRLKVVLRPVDRLPELLRATPDIFGQRHLAAPKLPEGQAATYAVVRDAGEIELGKLKDKLAGRITPARVDAAVARLVKLGLITKVTELEGERVKPRRERFVRLVPAMRKGVATLLEMANGDRDEIAAAEALVSLGRSWRTAIRQQAVLRALVAAADFLPLAALRSAIGSEPGTVVRALETRGIVEVEERIVRRDPLARLSVGTTTAPPFTPDQLRAWERIEAHLNKQPPSPATFLLHGVTGSGKTEVYLRALEQTLCAGRGAIVLVPEIALTPQTTSRFASRFPGRIAVLHSNLSDGERYDEWLRIQSGEADVVIGSRSAIFAPVQNLGLIVIDEEHEWTYKEQPKDFMRVPSYQTRDVAAELARLTGATVLLGSATPEVCSYYHTQSASAGLLQLPSRVQGHTEHDGDVPPMIDMPPVHVADLRQELKLGNRSIFSRILLESLQHTLDAGEQAILFLNRRGAATFVVCRDCGHVMVCKRCDIPLAYHMDGNMLLCHQCNLRENIPQRCPSCWSTRIRYFGIGTQRVADEVQRLYPAARVMRWDRDVTGGKHAHVDLMEALSSGQADIVVGTQMIAKGLDLPDVTLVGIVSADTGLHLPDFRAAERTFQLLTQVAGRAGRGPRGGRVILQTYTPDHYCIQAAARHDYAAFYAQEIAFRREHGYPPYTRLARLNYTHTNDERASEAAYRMRDTLQHQIRRLGLPGLDILGPAPCFHHRIRNRYRWQLVIRDRDSSGTALLALLHAFTFPLNWSIDVDPVSML